jgi:hypothetical protein
MMTANDAKVLSCYWKGQGLTRLRRDIMEEIQRTADSGERFVSVCNHSLSEADFEYFKNLGYNVNENPDFASISW